MDGLSLVGLAAALAGAGAVRALVAPRPPRVKWPNDVILGGWKLAGVLPESRIRDREVVVALGIGLNVNQIEFAGDLEQKATSLRLETGQLKPRPPLLAQLLEQLETWLERLAIDEGQSVVEAFADEMVGHGAEVVLAPHAGPPIRGIARGISPSGSLLLETAAGSREFHSGDVSLRIDPSRQA
jgi:BirA family transcriptional regulator, biotin operon repressor / biotin---[acetyl-CoA-carboxylase] ligase